MKMRIYLLLFIIVASYGFVHSNDQASKPQETFVLSKKQSKKIKGMSKDALKEHLGESTRNAFHAITELSSTVGSLQLLLADQKIAPEKKQIEVENSDKTLLQASFAVHRKAGNFQVLVASMQKRFSHIIEKLVDNQAPFKKASKDLLSGAYKLMMQVDQDLKKQVSSNKMLCSTLKQEAKSDSSVLMKQIDQSCESLTLNLNNLLNKLNTHECLKQV
jgi:hypothetical protein